MYILLLRTSRRVQGSHILHNNNVKYVRTFTVYIYATLTRVVRYWFIYMRLQLQDFNTFGYACVFVKPIKINPVVFPRCQRVRVHVCYVHPPANVNSG